MKMTFSTFFRVAASTGGAMMGCRNRRGSNECGRQRQGHNNKTRLVRFVQTRRETRRHQSI